MAVHLLRDLESLKSHLLEVGAAVERATDRAITALLERDIDIAREVIDGDDAIDAMEVGVEEECLKALALHQPVAVDLRFIITVLKVNNDLERVGDLATNISHRAIFLTGQPRLDHHHDFRRMADTARGMVHDALDALLRMDQELAHKVCRDDNIVDDLHREMFRVVENEMKTDPSRVERAMQWASCSRYLERIADLATNIAEDVIFLTAGEVVRHHGDL